MSLHRIVTVCLFACFLFAAQPSHAQEEALAAGLKFGVQQGFALLAEQGYNENCAPENLDHESDSSWYCSVFAMLSDAKKKEHEQRVLHHLEIIRGELANIREAVTAIQEGQDRLFNLNRQILLRLDEVGPETTIGQNLSHIRTVFAEQYVPLFSGEREFTADRLRAFAHRIVFVDNIHDRLGVINDQLTVPTVAGREPLLRAYARRSLEQLRAGKGASLDPSYVYLESIVDGLLADQRKGVLMYVWAAETLQSDCEIATAENRDVRERCADFRSIPHTASQYRDVFAKNLAAQLSEMNAGFEFMALGASDVHSRNANFLHPDAQRLFARADLFTAANLGEGFGLRGRVISMGDAFDPQIKIAGEMRTPLRAMHRVKTDPGMVDWWKASARMPVYDVVHFADQWRVYHYQLPSLGAGSYTIDATMPYKSDAAVAMVDLAGRQVPFGSFTAIERAGGGYALLSGEWNRSQYKSPTIGGGDFHPLVDEFFFDPARFMAGIQFGGRVEWKWRDVGRDQFVAGERRSFAVSFKKVRYPAGGEVTLHADFGDTYPTLCPAGECADTKRNTVLSRFVAFAKGPIEGRSAVANTAAKLIIDTDEKGKNGIVWERTKMSDEEILETSIAGKESARIQLDDTGRSVIFGGMTKFNIQTSGYADSRFLLVALPKIENAYLTR